MSRFLDGFLPDGTNLSALCGPWAFLCENMAKRLEEKDGLQKYLEEEPSDLRKSFSNMIKKDMKNEM